MTARTTLAQRLRDDRGSLPMVMLVSIVGMLLSAMLIPVLLQQDHSTRFDTTRVRALDGAQAGLDVTLGLIRNAVDAQKAGDATKLPCGPITGSVDGAADVSYRVDVTYLQAGANAADWMNYLLGKAALPPAESANKMMCVNGYGTFNNSTGVITPAMAILAAKGTSGTSAAGGGTQGRTLVSTYKFKTSNTNIPGGVIRIFPATGTSAALCLESASATPAAGGAVALQPCSTTTPPAAPQVFVYRTDLTLQLLSSITGSTPNGYCLTYPSSDGTNPTSGASVTFGACAALGSPLWNQQWSFDDNGHFRASLSTSKNSPGNLSGYCMDVASQTATTVPKIVTCAGSVSDPRQAWIPSPAVGAGAAAPPQWVNYYEFGRCLDVTGQNVNATYLIDYPCKQNPYPNAVAWNQKFTAPTIPSGASSATGQFYTTYNGTNYCLTSPGTDGGLLTVKTCGRAGQTWTVYNDDNSLSYTMKFTIVDSSGLCMGLSAQQVDPTWSAIDVETCAGRADQKWNAAPTTSSVLNTQEK